MSRSSERAEAVRQIDAATGRADRLDGAIQVAVDRVGRVNGVSVCGVARTLPTAELDRLLTEACAAAYNDRLNTISNLLTMYAHLFDQNTLDLIKVQYTRAAQT